MITREKVKTTLPMEEKGRHLRRPMGHMISPFEEMERALERFLPRSWLHPWQFEEPLFGALTPFEIRTPRIDMADREDEVYLRAEVPGVKKDDLEVSLSGDTLTIRGTVRHEAEKEEAGQYLYREMTCGGFSRTITLPVPVDVDKSKVVFKDGVLEMTLPKVEGAKARRITIEEG